MPLTIICEGAFNTVRLYTTDGQRIYWWQFEDGSVYFRDVSRMVDGYTGPIGTSLANIGPLRAAVIIMPRYDRGEHQRWRDDGDEPHKQLGVPTDVAWTPALDI